MKEYKHLGAYGLIINEGKILLIKKKTGPYDGLLDLPGGTIELNERPIDTLKRELKEEVGITINNYELFDADSISLEWKYQGEIINVHHIGIFYKILDYSGDIKKTNEVDEINDDSLGADFYIINELKKEELSKITIMELDKLGYMI